MNPVSLLPHIVYIYIYMYMYIYTYTHEVCPESKGKKVLNMYKIFNLKKRHCE